MLELIFVRHNVSRRIILFIDLLISLSSIVAAYFLRFNFSIPSQYIDPHSISSFYLVIPLVLSVRLISFLISRTYTGMVRYTGTKDAGRIFYVILLGSLFLFFCDLLAFRYTNTYIMPVSVIGIDFLATVFIMTFSRFFIKTLYFEYLNIAKGKKNVLIIGVSELALITKQTLVKDTETNYNILAFIDPSKQHKGQKLDGISIYGFNKIEELFGRLQIHALIFAERNISNEIKEQVFDICLSYNVEVFTLPDMEKWINGELNIKQIKELKIEDLLERDPIILDEAGIRKDTLNRTILITGAAGSIGSEIVRQLIRFQPKKLILFDQAESPLYDLELELKEYFNFFDFDIYIGNISDKYRIAKVFDIHEPAIVYHAAAYKHVPMMENNPAEAVRTNVLGTKILADLSLQYHVRKFVMISTDKAVRPTNVMGASKRIAEIYTQSLNILNITNFITTRFGNVLGSNGSVINRFKKQIDSGGPVTVTHKDITRYFMTIPEACQLVLEAGVMGGGGEIFVFNMGKSVKIADLAQKMIKLSGLIEGKDIQISYTGLRPGEKLYEELLSDKENTLPTHHPKILIGKIDPHSFSKVKLDILQLINLVINDDNFAIVQKMKEIVPDFVSQNSIYQELDFQAVQQKGTKSEKLKKGRLKNSGARWFN